MHAWSRDPKILHRALPVQNPVDGILSLRAFEVMKLCWELDPQSRPRMVQAQSRYQGRDVEGTEDYPMTLLS